MVRICFTLVLAATGAVVSPQREGSYLTPPQAGFHHCALIYERPRRSVEDMLPYVARLRDGKTSQWLFDAFLFLRFNMPSGVRTDEGPTRRDDWQRHLDDWFAPGRDLSALDEAIAQAVRSLGEPPAPRKVILSIPYPSREVRDFGAVDGSVVDLSTDEGLTAAIRWYVDQAERLFHQAQYRHLRLWGFYWMREEISPHDEPRVRRVADVLHERGYRLSWIPWWRGAGWDRWRQCGIDVAIMQPNYAFVSWTHGGTVRRNRLAVAAELCRSHGLGVEIEAGDVVHSDADRQAFLHYLADGGPERLGYREGACAYYLGIDTVETTAYSPDRTLRQLYHALADFVSGVRVGDPDPPQTWRVGPNSATGQLGQRTHIRAVDVFFDEPEERPVWKGRVEVHGRLRPQDRWLPLGWAWRVDKDAEALRHQVISLPVESTAKELQVRWFPLSGPAKPTGLRILAGGVGPETVRQHAAVGCSYTTDLEARRRYDDDGTKLVDGVVPERGFLDGKSVGWFSPRASILIDLGQQRNVDAIEVVCQGGGFGAVHWPSGGAVLSSSTRPPADIVALGPWRTEWRFIAAAPIRVLKKRSDTDMDGILRFNVSPRGRARHVHIHLLGRSWIMVSEVRVLQGAHNLMQEQGVRYELRPLPSLEDPASAPYADDGARLTDGIVAQNFTRHLLTGWNDGQPHTVTVDLGTPRTITSVTVWSLEGGLAGIYAPKSCTIEVSPDGVQWRKLGEGQWPSTTEDGTRCTAAPCPVKLGQSPPVRYIRTRVTPGRGWCMLSEIEVVTADARRY